MIYPERVRWDCPKEIRATLEPLLVFWLPFAPSWLEDLRVAYGDADGCFMQTQIHYPNRWAVLRVGESWLKQPDVEREDSLLHELAHVVVEPLHDASESVVEDLTEAETRERRMAARQIHTGVEAVAEDLARGMMRMFRSKVTS